MSLIDDLAPETAYDIIAKIRLSGPAVLKHTATLRVEDRGEYLRQAAQHFLSFWADRDAYKFVPVDVQTFVESKYFLDRRGVLYPAVMDELRELNSGEYVEAVLTGAIGTGKSTIALFTTAYQLYLVSCLRDPHRLFGLDPSSEIVFAFQSLNKMLARSVDYERFRSMISTSPYFARHFLFKKSISSEMVFPNHIVVRPLSGNVNAAIGSNIFGGDPGRNQLHGSTWKSRRHAVDGGAFDQAVEMYNSIVRRRKSRFMTQGGRLPGMLCLVSSKRYPGEFTDRKQMEAQEEQRTNRQVPVSMSMTAPCGRSSRRAPTARSGSGSSWVT